MGGHSIARTEKKKSRAGAAGAEYLDAIDDDIYKHSKPVQVTDSARTALSKHNTYKTLEPQTAGLSISMLADITNRAATRALRISPVFPDMLKAKDASLSIQQQQAKANACHPMDSQTILPAWRRQALTRVVMRMKSAEHASPVGCRRTRMDQPGRGDIKIKAWPF